MDNSKVLVNIQLKGRTMYRPEDCMKTIDKEIVIKKGKSAGKTAIRQFQVEDWSKMNTESVNIRDFSTNKTEKIVFHTRQCKPARQVINISEESYNYMISSECPDRVQQSFWKNLSKKKRLEYHLNLTAEALGGKLLSYTVFED